MVDKTKLLQKLLSSGEEGYTKALAALRGNGEKLPSFLRESAEATVEDPRLVKQASKRVLPDIETSAVHLADDLALPPGSGGALPPSIGSMVDDVVSGAPKNKLPNLAPAMVGAGLLGAGTAGYLTRDEEPTLDTSVPVEVLKNANRQLPKGTSSDRKETKSEKSAKTSIENAFQESGSSEVGQVPAPDDFDQRLEAAREQDRNRNLVMGILKATQQGLGATSGTKMDTSYADSELAKGDREVDRLGTSEKLKKERKDVLDEDVLRDPNSDISKQARDIAKKVGLKISDTVTAQQLKNAGLPIGNLLTQQMAIEARKEQNALQREMLAATRSEKKDQREEKTSMDAQKQVDKMVGNLTKSDDYKGYQAAKVAKVALDNALVEKNKGAIGSAFMMYAKIAQGDNSVVRESDMKNLAGSLNYSSPAEMISKLAAKAKGAEFTPLEIQQMKQVADVIERTKAKHIQQQLVPIQTRFEKYGLNPAESIDPSIIREMETANDSELPSTSGLTTISKAQKSNAPVVIRNIQTGTTKTLSVESAAKYLGDPRFEQVK